MKRSKLIKIAGLSVLAVGLASCASSTAGLQKATASNVGGVLSSQVSVSDIDRGATSVAWNAQVNTDKYSCESDDMVHNVSCVKNSK